MKEKKPLQVLRDDESKRFKYLKRAHVICYFDPCLQPLSCWPLLPMCLSASAVTLNNVGLVDEPRWVSGCHTPAFSRCKRMSRLCVASLFTCLPLFFCIRTYICVIVLLSFSWQAWRSPWGLLRDPVALAKGELLPLSERTVMTPRGNTRSTATTLSSAIASPWTGASPTTGLKSISTSCFFCFSFHLQFETCFPPRQACIMLGRLVTGRFASLIPVAVDGFYFCESTQHKAGLFFPENLAFSSVHIVLSFCSLVDSPWHLLCYSTWFTVKG